MRKRVILIGLSLLSLSALILTFVVAEGDPVEDALNGAGTATTFNQSSWNLTERGIDFDLFLLNFRARWTYPEPRIAISRTLIAIQVSPV